MSTRGCHSRTPPYRLFICDQNHGSPRHLLINSVGIYEHWTQYLHNLSCLSAKFSMKLTLRQIIYHAWSHWLDLVRSGESPNITRSIRYVRVIWFIFHVLQLLPIRFKQQNVCCNSKSTMQHQQSLDWNTYLPQVHACWSLSEHVSPPNCIQH